jgi:hypothetical protein
MFDDFLLKYTVWKDILKIINRKKIYIWFNVLASASLECKYIKSINDCKFQCKNWNNNISLLLNKGKMQWKNLYLSSFNEKIDYTLFDFVL